MRADPDFVGETGPSAKADGIISSFALVAFLYFGLAVPAFADATDPDGVTSPQSCARAPADPIPSSQLLFARSTLRACPDATERAEALITILDASAPELRAHAAAALARLDTAALPAILTAFEAQEPRVSGERGRPPRAGYLVWALANVPSAPSDALLRWARAAPSTAGDGSKPADGSGVVPDRWTIVSLVLGARADTQAAVAQLLDNPDPAISERGVADAAALGPSGKPLLGRLSARVEQANDVAALDAISRLGPIDTAVLQRWLAHSTDARVRARAAAAIGAQPGDTPSMILAIALISESAPSVREAIAQALLARPRIGPPGISALVEVLLRQADRREELLRLLSQADTRREGLSKWRAPLLQLALDETLRHPAAPLTNALQGLAGRSGPASPDERRKIFATLDAHMGAHD